MELSLLGIVVAIVGLYLAFKLAGAVLRLSMWLVAALGAYWFFAPLMGWVTLQELAETWVPDLAGVRIQESPMASQALDSINVRIREGLEGLGNRMHDGTLPDETPPLPEVPQDAEHAPTPDPVTEPEPQP